MSKICWLSVESPLAMNQFGYGANKVGSKYARRLQNKHQGYGDIFFTDEVCVKIDGKQHYSRRAVDQDGAVVDVFFSDLTQWQGGKALLQTFIEIAP